MKKAPGNSLGLSSRLCSALGAIVHALILVGFDLLFGQAGVGKVLLVGARHGATAATQHGKAAQDEEGNCYLSHWPPRPHIG